MHEHDFFQHYIILISKMYNIHRRSTFKKRTYPFTTLQKSVSRNNGHTSRLVVTADCSYVFSHLSISTSIYSLVFFGHRPREFPQKYTHSSSGFTIVWSTVNKQLHIKRDNTGQQRKLIITCTKQRQTYINFSNFFLHYVVLKIKLYQWQ